MTRILILSNMIGSGLKDDTLLKNSFEEDGNIVDLKKINFDEKYDDQYDVIIRRNTWVSTEEDTIQLYQDNLKLIDRLKNKKVKTVNLEGLDGIGKGYLCELFKNNASVIPTISSINDFDKLPVCSKYVVKTIKSFGNGLFQKVVAANDVKEIYNEGDIIQPFMQFKSEIQCYYVGQKLMYIFEYTPSKYPHYPEPTMINFNDEEIKIADEFARYSNLKYGFQRIDFLRLEDDRLLLMEIEDHAAFMNLQRLPKTCFNEVMDEFKKNIYSYLSIK